MIDKDKIKAVAFDFGGTLDSPFLHWMDIYIHLYTTKLNLPLRKENFRDSYVYASHPVLYLMSYIAHTPCCLFPIIMEILRRL